MTLVPTPSDIRTEDSTSSAARTLYPLVPYKTTGGYWVFVPFGSQPTGATQGALVHGGSYDTLVTTTTVGLRLVKTSVGGYVLAY